MAKFRKKPIVIEAVTVVETKRNRWSTLPEWIRNAYDEGKLKFCDDGIIIKTLEGDMLADYLDWIIRGVKGEIYPCKPDIFEATYEAAE